MINIEYILFILLIIIILIFINFKNNEKFASDQMNAGVRIEGYPQKYIGPIIFLQATNDGTTATNCLGNTDEYRCIGKYPSDNNNDNGKNYYPNEDELRNLSEPNIIYIPKGQGGQKGETGQDGSAANIWLPIDNSIDAVKIGTDGANKTFEIKGDRVQFNSNTNITDMSNMICIEEEPADIQRPNKDFWKNWRSATPGGLQWGNVPDDNHDIIKNRLRPLSDNCINREIIETLIMDYSKVF